MKIEKTLRRRHVVSLAFGAMVGWSWVLLSGTWIERAGVLGAALALGIASFVMALIALTYAELAAAMPKNGGEHVYLTRAFGRGPAFICSWALMLAYVSVIAFEVVAFPFALSYLFPAINVGKLWQVAGWDVYASQVALGLGGALALTVVNLRGAGSAANVQVFVTTLILLAGALLIVGAGRTGSTANFAPLFSGGIGGIMSVVVMVPLMFVGFDVIPQAAEEIALPPERTGRLLFVSVLGGAAWYIVIVLAVGFILDPATRAAADLSTAVAASHAWDAEWASTLLVCGGIAGIVTTWNAFIVGASRLGYALAEHGLLPRWLAGGAVDARAPGRILWAIFILSGSAAWFGRPVLVWLVDAGSLGVVIAYGFVAAAFLALRKREPDMPRPYRLAGGRWIGGAALIAAVLLVGLYLPGSPAALIWPQEWLIVGGWAVFGLALYLAGD